MGMDGADLHDLARLWADHHGLSVVTVAKRAACHGRLFVRLGAGEGCTMRTYNRALQWLVDHWPPDLAWPSDIPRPSPTPGSPAAEAASVPSEQDERLEAARELGPSGRVRRPAALLAAIGLPADAARATYDDVCKRYRDDGPAGPTEPRRTDPPSWTARILDALVDAGDVRFKARRDRRERNAELAGRFGFEGAA